jgi:hypothetical protein
MNSIFFPELLGIGLAVLLVGSLLITTNCTNNYETSTAVVLVAPTPSKAKVAPDWIRDVRGRD